MVNKSEIKTKILERIEIIQSSTSLVPEIEKSTKAIIKCLRNGNKIVLFGNGGSAADAQHVAAEFVGRFNSTEFPNNSPVIFHIYLALFILVK